MVRKKDGRADEKLMRALHGGWAPTDDNIPDGPNFGKGDGDDEDEDEGDDLNVDISDSDDEFGLG